MNEIYFTCDALLRSLNEGCISASLFLFLCFLPDLLKPLVATKQLYFLGLRLNIWINIYERSLPLIFNFFRFISVSIVCTFREKSKTH